MINPKDLRKIKIIFKRNEENLSPAFFENLEEIAKEKDLKNFLRGCKHVLEKHYAEAIKWFQLVEDDDANLMILLCAYKLGDSFLFSEYYKEDLSGNILESIGLEVFLQKCNETIKISNELLKKLKEELEE